MAYRFLRFPGGTITCQYHWEDAVGPKENRIRRKNLIWGGELDPSFGTAEFISLCREIGAEPMICVNMVSGTPEASTYPRQAPPRKNSARHRMRVKKEGCPSRIRLFPLKPSHLKASYALGRRFITFS